jgi:hypothetical protein
MKAGLAVRALPGGFPIHGMGIVLVEERQRPLSAHRLLLSPPIEWRDAALRTQRHGARFNWFSTSSSTGAACSLPSASMRDASACDVALSGVTQADIILELPQKIRPAFAEASKSGRPVAFGGDFELAGVRCRQRVLWRRDRSQYEAASSWPGGVI